MGGVVSAIFGGGGSKQQQVYVPPPAPVVKEVPAEPEPKAVPIADEKTLRNAKRKQLARRGGSAAATRQPVSVLAEVGSSDGSTFG